MIMSNSDGSYEMRHSIIQDLSFDTAKEEFKKRNVEFKENSLSLFCEDGLYNNLVIYYPINAI